jgi:hypothetical protein
MANVISTRINHPSRHLPAAKVGAFTDFMPAGHRPAIRSGKLEPKNTTFAEGAGCTGRGRPRSPWFGPSGWDREFADSPLEEAVSSEPVSVWNFPASSEFAGNFARFGISAEFQGPKTYVSPTTYGANSLDIGAGNFYDVAGN